MARISHAEFQDELNALSSAPGAIQYATQDAGTIAPVDRLPAPTIPNSRRLTRVLPQVASALPVIGNVIDATCIAHSIAPETVTRNIGSTTAGYVANRIWDNAVHNTLQRVCRATPNYDPPGVSPPFSGGQCPGVRYRCTVTMNVVRGAGCDIPETSSFTDDIKGPIAGFRVIDSSIPGGPGRGTVQGFARSLADDLDDPQRWVNMDTRQNFGGCEGGPTPTIESVSIVRQDGQPDVCGNPRPEYPRDNGDVVFAPNVDIDISPGVSVPITPTITADLDGTININLPELGDVSIDIGGIDINLRTPQLPQDPPLPVEPEPAPDTPQRPDPGGTGTQPDDNPPPPPSNDDPALEEPEEQPERVIRGVLVTVTDITESSSMLIQTDNPDVYIPDLGVVNFRVRVNDSDSGWTPDQRVKNRRCFIPCEWDGGAFDVAGTPRNGVVWTLTPVYDVSSIPVTTP